MSLSDKVMRRIERWRLQSQRGVSIAPDAQVNARNITLCGANTLRIGAGSVVEATVDFERIGARLIIGRNTYVGASMFKCAHHIELGDDVEIAWNCTIADHDWEPLLRDHRRTDKRLWYEAEKDWRDVAIAPVRIGHAALIGFNAVILKGVHIGEGAVVGVQSVVTRDVEPYTVVAGAPARVVRRLPRNAYPGPQLVTVA